MDDLLNNLKYDAHGLVPAIIQDHVSGDVLMMAWMNHQSVQLTLETGKTHFFSRSRNKLWLKGESSGHLQHVKSIRVDCDADVLLISVEQVGVACHEGYRSCFFREYDRSTTWKIVGERLIDPAEVYNKK